MEKVQDYVDTVNAPWGKMFYDLLFMQLNLSPEPKLKILDFGSGLGVTSSYYAAWHDVTAIDQNKEMIDCRFVQNEYTQIHGGIEQVNNFADNTFDIVFCHNVLEYIEDKEPILKLLFRLLKVGGKLSVVKHNRVGRVIHTAVFRNSPEKALSIMDEGANDANQYLGTQYIYSNDQLIEWAARDGGELVDFLGMRAFWALGQDNAVKFDDDWYENMLALEYKAASIDEYRQAAFLHHLIFERR